MLETIEVVLECEWEEAEEAWIEYFRKQGYDLTNHTDGGEGVRNIDEETRLRMSMAAKKKLEDPEYRE